MKAQTIIAGVAFLLAGGLAAMGASTNSPGPSAGVITTLPSTIEFLFKTRASAVVSVEFFIQEEIERERVTTLGIVLNRDGVIVLPESAIALWVPPERLTDFKVRYLGVDSEGIKATYLGVNYLSNTHYIKITPPQGEEPMASIGDFPMATPKMGEMLWGVSSQDEDFLYKPVLNFGTVVFLHSFALNFGFTRGEVTGIGAPVFNAKGDFVGVGTFPSSQSYIMYMGKERGRISLSPYDETNTFIWAEDYLKFVNQVPLSPAGDPEPWLGIDGIQPLDKEVSHFMKLDKQGAVVVSEIITPSPAEAAGFKPKDIIVEIDGTALPKMHPDQSLLRWLSLYLGQKKAGDTIAFSVIRGEERIALSSTLVERPRRERNAERTYFPRLGLSVRYFTLEDALRHRLFRSDLTGAVVSFLRENAPAATAEMRIGDWIKEVDGTPVDSYQKTIEALKAAENDPDKKEVVIMVSRGTETKVLRLKLN